MSTRSNVLVYSYGIFEQFYHHCDGYPEGVGKMLAVAKSMAVMMTKYKIEYSEEEKDYFKKFNSDELYKNFIEMMDNTDKGRFEPEGKAICLHTDIEYLYIVSIDDSGIKITYTEVKPFFNSSKQGELIEKAELGNEIKLSLNF